MAYTSDGFATMLLTMALSPNREEYARPFSTQEFSRLEERTKAAGYQNVGELIGIDISGLMIQLKISEEEAYRIFTLLSRDVQMGYAVENFLLRGIEVVTRTGKDYPERVVRKMRSAAPPYLYRCGEVSLIGQPAVAIIGISGVKTTPDIRDGIIKLVRSATKMGYTILTGGELGVAHVAAMATAECGGTMIDVVGGGLYDHLTGDPIDRMYRENRMAVISLEHPEAMFTVSHAIARNKVIFSLADAAFICNTDNKRGETDALHNRYCDWIYAWSGYPANHALVSKGATPVADFRKFDFEKMCKHWNSSQSEQINMFDML